MIVKSLFYTYLGFRQLSKASKVHYPLDLYFRANQHNYLLSVCVYASNDHMTCIIAFDNDRVYCMQGISFCGCENFPLSRADSCAISTTQYLAFVVNVARYTIIHRLSTPDESISYLL
jgi:hypothetical protein